MLSSIKGIKFKGAAFDNETTLRLFSDEVTDRFCLAFGRNGSGKTTVARAISKAVGDEKIEDIVSAQFVGLQGAVATISDDERKAIFVFDEDYTNSKVRLKEDGLGTIVMFGELGDIADKIKNAEKALEEAEGKHREQNENYAKYCDSKNVLSPEHHNNLLVQSLKGDAHWAGREREIADARRNANVDDTMISEIMRSDVKETLGDLQTAYKAKLAELTAAKATGTKITASIPHIDDYTPVIEKIAELLAVKIEEPALSEREQKLLCMAQSGKQSRLAEIKREFSAKTDFCPFCLQDVSVEYKEELVRGIEKVLGKAAEEHEKALTDCSIKILDIDLSAFEVSDKKAVDDCRQAITTVNARIEDTNKAIERKKNNLYTPITDFTTGLKAQADALVALFAVLDKKKDEYNERQKNVPQIQAELRVINRKLAYYEIKDTYADYAKQKVEKTAEKKALDELASILEKAKGELDKLNQKKKNVKIAVDFINNGLKYVFFSDDRLTVRVEADNYTLKSNGKDVKPKNISVGERNILALCYFFTEMLNNVDEKDIHKKESLIVLDDPVSSFDLENRVGIISYLKSQIIKVLRGNPESKIVLLSHDLLTIYDLEKAIREVAKQIKIAVRGHEEQMLFHLIELDRKEVRPFNAKKRNEYSFLLQAIYEYASEASAENELVIGNIMRRAVEAFGTFEFRKSIDEISCDPAILSIIKEEKRDYFENLMYRLILNGESHLEERTKSMTDNNFFATISPDEKKRTARRSLFDVLIE